MFGERRRKEGLTRFWELSMLAIDMRDSVRTNMALLYPSRFKEEVEVQVSVEMTLRIRDRKDEYEYEEEEREDDCSARN